MQNESLSLWKNFLEDVIDHSLEGFVDLLVLEECESTMKSARSYFDNKNLLAEHLVCGNLNSSLLWCYAYSQSKGVGRQQKEWHSSSPDGMYLTILSYKPVSYQSLSGLSLVVGTSVAKVLESYGLNPGLKWPNDVLILGKKICGILIETFTSQSDSSKCHLVIGVGLNVNQGLFPSNLNAISMSMVLGHPVVYEKVCLEIANQISLDLMKFNEHGLGAFIAFWRSRSIMSGVLVRDKEGLVLGKVVDIDKDGFLLIQGAVETIRMLNIDEGLQFEF